MNPELVQLSWDPTTDNASGEGTAFVIGYRVYRSFLGESATLLNEAPARKPTWTDRPAYGTYTYFVTAVTSLEPDIESDASGAVTVEFRDMLAPPAPSNVTALVGDDAVRLIWAPGAVPDLAGYIVYRWDGTSKVRLNTALVTETSYRDSRPDPGVEYIYGVASVDTSGNEGTLANSQKVTFSR